MNKNSNQTLREKKAAVRSKIGDALRALPPEERLRDSQRIVGHLPRLKKWSEARIIALFHPLPDEPNLLADGFPWTHRGPDQRFLFPVVRPSGALLFREAVTSADFVSGSFGTREPLAERSAVALSEINLFLVPGRAFDTMGRRIGRGGGHYDRTLAGVDAERMIGVAFDVQVVDDSLPVEAHDICVGYILTPELPRPTAPATFLSPGVG